MELTWSQEHSSGLVFGLDLQLTTPSLPEPGMTSEPHIGPMNFACWDVISVLSYLNSLAPGRLGWNIIWLILKHIFWIGIFSISP